MTNKKSKFNRVLLVLALVICFMFFSIVLALTFFYNRYSLDISKLTSVNNGIMVYSSSGVNNTLYNTNRSIIEIETLPDYVKDAFIDIEDKRFYSHNGFDLKRIAKSAFVNVLDKSKSQGASTISQQLIKNALLSNEKTYSRKLKEIILSIKMEKKFTKDEILEMYLNTIYFGANAYGIENASKIYFNKSAKDLTINEACCLAGIIKSPATYSPKINYSKSISRKNLVANKMFSNGNISKEDYEMIINSPIVLANNVLLDHSYEEEAIYEACQLLNISERELINKQYKILTFKQDDLQEYIIETHKNILSEDFDSLSVVANNKGQVKAYYAKSNYNLHDLRRQPASLLKPLAVYLPCLTHNILTPATQILDEPINYSGFSPHNADKQYHGYVTTRDAISQSLNVPAVKALDYLGIKKSKEMLINLGINLDASDFNLSLALGATKKGVKLLDLLAAYTSIANLGKYYHISFVDKILDENNNIIYEYEEFPQIVADNDACFMLTDMLKDCAKTGTAKRLAELNLPLASKTGTTSNGFGNTDLYNVSYTTQHTMLSWVANLKNTILPNGMLSSSEPTDINKHICSYLYSNKDLKDFNQPENVVKMPYDNAELASNHVLVTPKHNIERYINYDYFKADFPPKNIDFIDEINLEAYITRKGIELTFEPKKHLSYKLFKQTKDNLSSIQEISNTCDQVRVCDGNVFNHEEIEYYITDENGKIISQIVKLRPKDYLINQLNNEIISSKKKWLV